jgi:preprotein translocase subunit YajC
MSTINKIIIISIIFFISISLILFYIIIPTVREIKKLNEYIYQEQKDLEVKFQKMGKIKKIRQNFLKIKPYFPQLNNIYLTEDKKIEFFTILEKTAQKHNLKFDLNLLPIESSKIIALQFDLEGEYFDFLKYLIDLEKLDYYININKILIKDVALKTQTEDLISFSFLDAYFQKEKNNKKNFGKIKAILFGEIYQKEKDFLLKDNLF